MTGFVDAYRMTMGWWSAPPPAPMAVGSLSIGRVRVVPSLSVSGVTSPKLRVQRVSIEKQGLSIDRVGVVDNG